MDQAGQPTTSTSSSLSPDPISPEALWSKWGGSSRIKNPMEGKEKSFLWNPKDRAFLASVHAEPKTFSEVVGQPCWQQAMTEEL